MITPESLAACGTEHGHQTALFCWAAQEALFNPKHACLGLMFAIPNGGLRNPVTANRLKAEGVKAGVPDIFLPVARNQMFGLFIEMKKPKGNLQDNQIKWIDNLREQGYGCAVCYGWQQARDCLLAYI